MSGCVITVDEYNECGLAFYEAGILEKYTKLCKDPTEALDAINLIDELRTLEHQSEIPSHFTTYTAESPFFSISYSQDWECLVTRMPEIKENTRNALESIQNNRPLESYSTIFVAGVSNEKIHSVIAAINVESLPSNNWSLEETVEDAMIDGRKAMTIDFELIPLNSSLKLRHMAAIMMMIGKNIWGISCSAKACEYYKYQNNFYSVIGSVRIQIVN
ncbi:MAG: hypothetical protein PHQ86_01615 [Dehalococcoidales bacterium]|nr:hypothetical protein [Dehalococcoidales bacterium]